MTNDEQLSGSIKAHPTAFLSVSKCIFFKYNCAGLTGTFSTIQFLNTSPQGTTEFASVLCGRCETVACSASYKNIQIPILSLQTL